MPRTRYKIFTDEARRRSADVGKFLADGPRLQGLAGAEAIAFIDGTRSILDIYDAVRAEYGNVTTGSTEYKFAYVVTPQTPDIDLEAVANLIRALEKAGLIEIVRR